MVTKNNRKKKKKHRRKKKNNLQQTIDVNQSSKSSDILVGKLLDKIPYMDDLPCNNPKITYLDSKEFAEKFNCEYFEGLISDTANYQRINFTGNDDYLLNAVLERLNNPLQSIAIINMGAKLGHGLFALENIPLGTVLGVYSGKIGLSKSSIYSYRGTDAKEYGGLARFMQHLPISIADNMAYFQKGLEDPKICAFGEVGCSIKKAKQLLKNDKPMFHLRLQRKGEYMNLISPS
ncbi:MAG: hypothetical protein COC15_03825 [Legionellales bacterium]|nr:MAG: hypothetical protein COC15_03825 [Legionellales bacterium]